MIAKLFISGLLFWRIREVRHKVVYLFDNVFRVEAIAFWSDITIPRIDPTLPTAPIFVESTLFFSLELGYGRNLGQVVWATTFCSVAPNICGPSEWNLPHVILLASRICRWFLDFWKIYGALDITVLHTSLCLVPIFRKINPVEEPLVSIEKEAG